MRKTFFSIAFVGRSGSSYLEGLIDSHPEAQCQGELFCEGGEYVSSGLSLSGFLQRVHCRDCQASGFKLSLIHFRQFPQLKTIMKARGYKVIVSYRENKVDQYISMRLAQINGSWRSDFGAYSQHSFIADPRHMARHLRKFEHDDAGVLKFTAGLERILVPYEQITRRETAQKILLFLGLPASDLESVYMRQRRSPSQRDALENYDGLVKHFERTRWLSYFTDERGRRD